MQEINFLIHVYLHLIKIHFSYNEHAFTFSTGGITFKIIFKKTNDEEAPPVRDLGPRTQPVESVLWRIQTRGPLRSPLSSELRLGPAVDTLGSCCLATCIPGKCPSHPGPVLFQKAL